MIKNLDIYKPGIYGHIRIEHKLSIISAIGIDSRHNPGKEILFFEWDTKNNEITLAQYHILLPHLKNALNKIFKQIPNLINLRVVTKKGLFYLDDTKTKIRLRSNLKLVQLNKKKDIA